MKAEHFFVNEAKKAYDIEAFLRKELDSAGFSHAEVKKTPLGTRVVIYALRPGLVIGGGGENVKRLTASLSTRFGIENPNLEVEQVQEQYLDPHIVAWRIARALEKGTYFKRIVNIMLERVMAAGAKGVEIRLSGKLPSARAKTWIFVDGKLRKCGQEAIDQVQVAYATSLPKTGTIGVKVSILPPDAQFSDDIRPREMPKVEDAGQGKNEAEEVKDAGEEKVNEEPAEQAGESQKDEQEPATSPQKD